MTRESLATLVFSSFICTCICSVTKNTMRVCFYVFALSALRWRETYNKSLAGNLKATKGPVNMTSVEQTFEGFFESSNP